MAQNHILLETIQLSQSAASVTFDNIPQTGYTDLKIVMSPRDTYAGVSAAIFLVINGSTSFLSSRYLQGAGSGTPVSATLSSSGLAGLNTGSTATSNTFSNIEVYFPNYTSSNYKSYSVDSVTENNSTEAYTNFVAGLWSSNSAITSLGFTCGGSFVAGSTFSIYGIAALNTTPAIAPFASGGNIVANDGTYWYHAFLSSGTFTPLKTLSCDVLTIAGGGAGGNDDVRGGGGGAGGIFYATSQSVLTAKTVTIGAGGVAGLASTRANTAGSNSTFEGLTAAVGGGRGGGNTITGVKTGGNGGSGGGGTTSNSQPSTSAAGGSSTQTGTGGTGYGNAGGAGGNNGASGGGGGGAGGAGTGNISSYGVGGTGGAGLNTWSAWATATNTGVSGFYAGGGGGGGTGGNYGNGGSGGGGRAGDNNGVSVAGTQNTGSGGGGRGGGDEGSNGGSGIVIVRYPMV
jgi:hypothetical protein